MPHMPDKVKKVSELKGMKVQQVAIGSCTNSSYKDMMTVAAMLDGKIVKQGVSLGISPGSRQVLEMITESSGLAPMIKAGARILESGCGPCIGMGFAPPTGSSQCAFVQPQLRGPLRHEVRKRAAGLPRDLRRRRAHGRDDRPAHTRHGTDNGEDAQEVRDRRRDDHPASFARGGEQGGDSARPEHRPAAPQGEAGQYPYRARCF